MGASGGTIYLAATTMNVGTALVQAKGGGGGGGAGGTNGCTDNAGAGGSVGSASGKDGAASCSGCGSGGALGASGADGMIRLDYGNLTGSPSPAAAFTKQYGQVGTRVGIGTTTPTANLQVIGNVAATGYFDIAEDFPVNGQIRAGDVLVIDTAHPGGLIRSSRAFDPLIAGVVSDKPAFGITMPGGGIPMALMGRVKTRVTLEAGAIGVGDVLTSSSTPGRAMRCKKLERCLHAVIGKALESYPGPGVDEKDPQILVLVRPY